jgi:sugar phosphate isomerase/epimerase
MYTRRGFGRVALGAAPLAAAFAAIDSKVRGVQFGLQTYVFTVSGQPRTGILDTIVQAMVDCGLGECEAYGPVLEPGDLTDRMRAQTASAEERAQAREALAKWRTTVPLDYYQGIRKKFNAAGVDVWCYGSSFGPADGDIDRAFEQAKALGARLITSSIGLTMAKRVAPFAEKHGILVGLFGNPTMHGTNPDQINKPEQYLEGVAISKQFRIVLDIGDATGGGWDALKFVTEHAEQIAMLYVKDRKKDNTSVPFGEGDTPIKAVLQLIRDKQYPIRCYMDCDYRTDGTRAEAVEKSYEYAKAAIV